MDNSRLLKVVNGRQNNVQDDINRVYDIISRLVAVVSIRGSFSLRGRNRLSLQSRLSVDAESSRKEDHSLLESRDEL